MARLPIYTQKTGAQTKRATGEEFGAPEARGIQALGQGTSDLGGALEELDRRKRNREETIERVRAINAYGQEVEQEFTRVQTEEDLSSTETVKNYTKGIRERMNAVLSEHRGSEESRAELAATLEQYHGRYAQAAYKASVTAQFKIMGEHMDGVGNRLADLAGDMPESTLEHLGAVDVEVAKMAGALTPEQEAGYRQGMKQHIVQSAVSSYLNTGNTEGARAILAGEGMAELLDPDVHRQMKTNILIAERKTEKGAIKAQQDREYLTQMLGRPPTAAELARKAGVAAPVGAQTLAEKVAELEEVTGKPATQAQIDKLHGAYIAEGGEYGSGLKGKIMTHFNNLAPALASGLATDEELRTLDTSVTEYLQPIQYVDQATGQVMTRRASLPPHVIEAYQKAGRPLPNGELPSGEQAATGETEFEITPEPDKTIWGRRSNIAGPVPAAAQTAGQVPGVGAFFEGGGQYTVDREYALRQQKALVRTLQNSPRFSEGERKSIEQEVSIVGKAWDNTAAYEKRLIGLDEFLAEELQKASADLMNTSTSVEMRKAAMKDLSNITNFRAHLGLPPRVKTVEEAKKLPPGTEFIGPDSRIWIVPRIPKQQEQEAE